MSKPEVSVSKSLVKKRKFCRLPALVMPSAMRSSTSSWSSEKFCVTASRSLRSIWK